MAGGRCFSKARAGVVGGLLALVVAAGCSPARTLEAAGLLADVAREAPAEPPRRVETTYEGAAGPRVAHLYPPARGRAALVLVPGATEAALEDPRLVNFAGALSRRGFLVMVPELAGQSPLQVSAGDADAVADAVRYLIETAGADDVGLAAPSYAVGPTVQAALRDGINERVGFIVAIGGYHDIVAGITFITTGAFREGPDEPWRRGAFDRRAKWLFLEANLAWIDDPADAGTLGAIARARRADPTAVIDALAARLGPEGQAVLAAFVNEDPDRVPALLAELPPRMQAEIAALDLARRELGRLRARLILIHGRNDPLVPYTESLNLARAVGPERSSVYLLDGLDHVDIGGPSLGDLATLLGAAYRVLAARDAAAPPAALPRAAVAATRP